MNVNHFDHHPTCLSQFLHRLFKFGFLASNFIPHLCVEVKLEGCNLQLDAVQLGVGRLLLGGGGAAGGAGGVVLHHAGLSLDYTATGQDAEACQQLLIIHYIIHSFLLG